MKVISGWKAFDPGSIRRALLFSAVLLWAVMPAESQSQQLPDGEGKEIVEAVCGQCHGLNTVTGNKLARADWEDVVNGMISLGAPLEADQAEIVVEYLARNFGQAEAAPRQKDSKVAGIRTVGPAEQVVLPEPVVGSLFAHLRRVEMIDWPSGGAPVAPPGFRVTLFADGFQNPRWLCALPNGDVLVAESARKGASTISGERYSADRIAILRDADQDGRAEVHKILLTGLNEPIGMAFLRDQLYVANIDGLLAFPYQLGQTEITAQGKKIIDLPDGGIHNTRNVRVGPDGSKLYITVGSATNFGAEEIDHLPADRAAIWEVNPDGSGKRVIATGIRSPLGIDWEPVTHTLWTVSNTRGGLGEDVPLDYFTSIRDGGFYGWPFYYWGPNEETRLKPKRPDLLDKVLTPDYALGAHVSPLGLVFYTGSAFPEQYQGGAFITEHGSVLRSSSPAGYKVVFISFQNGRPVGDPQDFLTGFLASEGAFEGYGRPAGLVLMPDGSLLVADDAGNKVWKVSYTGSARSAASR